MDLVDLHSRSALDDAVETMRRFQAPWGVAGGWAIELLVNQRLRRHADIDVAILRAHQSRLWTDLEPNAVQVVIDGALRTWDASDWIPPPIHEVHLGWANGSRLEILLNEHDSTSDEWIYRRNDRVRRELGRVFTRHDGVPCLAPEIVLLYKSKGPRSHDEADFTAALLRLSHEEREWLRAALVASAPGHPWIHHLAVTM